MSFAERELWSAATMVLRRHGDQAPRFVAERIGVLAIEGDHDGVKAWRAIARRLDQLTHSDHREDPL